MVKKNKNKNKKARVDIVTTESFQQVGRGGVFPSEVRDLNLDINLGENREFSTSIIERPAGSSEKGETLWERKVVNNGQNGIEVIESWNNEVLNERKKDAVVPTVKEDHEGNVEEVSENLTNQKEVVLRTRKWETEKNEYEEKVTIKFDEGISSRRLTDGGQVNFFEYQQNSPVGTDQPSPESSPLESDFKQLLSDDEIRKADKEQLKDLKERVDAELEIRRQVETDSTISYQSCGIEVKPKT